METAITRFIEALPGLVWTSSPDGDGDCFNRQWLQYTGFSQGQTRGSGWQAALHPQDSGAILQFWREHILSGAAGIVETRLRRFDGVYRWFQLHVAPQTDEAGKVIQWCALGTDIDSLKCASLDGGAGSDRKVAIDTLPTLAWSSDANGAANFFNRHYLNYVGMPSEQLVGWGWTAAIHPADLSELVRSWSEIRHQEQVGEVEARLRRHDGTYRTHLIRAAPEHDQNDKLVAWHGVNIDIEDRKQVETQLNWVNSLFKQAQHISHIGSFWSDLEADQHFWSDELYRIFELEPGTFKITIATFREYVHPDDLARYDGLVTQSWEGEGYQWAFRIMPKPGIVKHLHSYCRRVPEITDRLVFFGTIQDVTEFKRVEDALRQSEAFLAEGEAVSGTGSFLWNIEMQSIRWSSQLYRIFDFEIGSPLTFERIEAHLHPEDRHLMTEMIERARSGLDAEHEQRVLMSGGGTKTLRIVARFEKDRDGHPQLRGIVEDVTERRRSEQALSRVRSELAHVTRVASLNTLTASIAHEVNQPLCGIMTNASACLRMLAAEPPDIGPARRTVERLIRDNNRARDVIARLRALFANKQATIERVDLNEATREVIALSMHELHRNEIAVRLDLEDALPAVAGDKVQLQQVILNLVLNAADALCAVKDRPRSLYIGTELTESGKVQLAVRDTGVGLGDESLAHLFDAFFTTKPSGMGIGLSVSRSIIEGHRGCLWAEQNSGHGATFLFAVPVAEEETEGV